MRRAALAAGVALALGGCLPSHGTGWLNAIDSAAEPEVDALVEFMFTHGCRLPPDVVLRNIAGNPDLAQAVYLACPEYRQLADLLTAGRAAPLSAPVEIAPIRLVPAPP